MPAPNIMKQAAIEIKKIQKDKGWTYAKARDYYWKNVYKPKKGAQEDEMEMSKRKKKVTKPKRK